MQWLNGGEAKPTAIPPRPFEKGVGRRPTLIGNVETFAHVALIARFGPAWFRQVGQPQAPGSMLVTLSGAVSDPGVYEIEVGTPIGAALTRAGADRRTRSVLIGGYFGSWHDLARPRHCRWRAGPFGRSAPRRERVCSSRFPSVPAGLPRRPGCSGGSPGRAPGSAVLAFSACPQSPTTSPSLPLAARMR